MPSPESPRPDQPDQPDPKRPVSPVVLAVVIVTSVSGYFMGLNQTDRASVSTLVRPGAVGQSNEQRDPVTEAFEREGVLPVAEYAKLGESRSRPNFGWRSTLVSLKRSPLANTNVSTAPATDAERQWAIQRRAERRAFDGAPPVVPHPVDATSSANCRACHALGLAVRDVVAPKMSHPEMGNCTQCHVPQDGGLPRPEGTWDTILAANSFIGRASVGKGSRAWPGAPPTIPHGSWMRQDCASCHGPAGLEGLRTSHVDRALCTQCHVPEAGFEWIGPAAAVLAGPAMESGLNAAR